MNNSGYVIVVEKDTNQYSPTYGQTRTRTYVDTTLCPYNQDSSSTSDHYALYVTEYGAVGEEIATAYGTLDYMTIRYFINDSFIDDGHTGFLDVVVGDLITTLDGAAFYGQTTLKSITLSSTVNNIGGQYPNDLVFDGCTALEKVTCLCMTPPFLQSNAFSDASQNLVIYVPASSLNAYKTATGWSTYASKIQAIPS